FYALGKDMYDTSAVVRVFGLRIFGALDELWVQIKYGAIQLWVALPRLASNDLNAMINEAKENIKEFMRVIQFGDEALGLDKMAKAVGKGLAAIVDAELDGPSAFAAALEKQKAEALAEIERIRKELEAEAINHDPAVLSAAGGPTKNPGKRKGKT